MEDIRQKKRTNGKAKGNGFETSVVKLLASKFPPLQFRRSQSSGAILGGKNEVNVSMFSEEAKVLFVGDVVPSNEADVLKAEGWRFKFTVECKFYKEPDKFGGLFTSPQVAKWFEQAKTDASKLADKLPLLIFKFNHTPIFAAFETDVEPPNKLAPLVDLRYNWKLESGVIESRVMRISLLEDLLDHADWWKLKTRTLHELTQS